MDNYVKAIQRDFDPKVRPFLAAKAVNNYVKAIQRDFDPDEYILPIRTNDLTTDKKPEEI